MADHRLVPREPVGPLPSPLRWSEIDPISVVRSVIVAPQQRPIVLRGVEGNLPAHR
jgi:hypothetical protein